LCLLTVFEDKPLLVVGIVLVTAETLFSPFIGIGFTPGFVGPVEDFTAKRFVAVVLLEAVKDFPESILLVTDLRVEV
jgi:hypothetical protein